MARLITETWDPEDILLMPAGNFSNGFVTSPVVDFPAAFQAGNQTRSFITAPAVATSFDGFFIYINSNQASNQEYFYVLIAGSAVYTFLVRDNLTALLSLYKGGTFTGTGVDLTTGIALLGTGTHPLAQGSHYHIQVGYDATGTIEIRVDGNTDISVAGVPGLAAYTQTAFRSVQLAGVQQYYFDSYYKNDTTTAEDNTWGGVIRMVSQVPIADGFYTAWAKSPSSGDGYAHINETPYDGDTSTIYSSTNNQKDSFDPGAHGLNVPDVIKAISTRWVCRKVSTGQVKPFFRIAGTDYSMAAAQDIGTDYSVVVDRRTKNPATAAGWQLTDTFEVGIEAIV